MAPDVAQKPPYKFIRGRESLEPFTRPLMFFLNRDHKERREVTDLRLICRFFVFTHPRLCSLWLNGCYSWNGSPRLLTTERMWYNREVERWVECRHMWQIVGPKRCATTCEAGLEHWDGGV